MKSPAGLVAAATILTLLALPAAAAGPALAAIPGGPSVSSDDVDADAQRIPPELRKKALADAADVATLSRSLLVTRALAAQAEAAQLDKDPVVAARLRLARERVLAEARVAQIEGQPPPRETLERLAQAEYRANPEKYSTPEQIRVRHILIDGRSCEPEKRIAQILEQARAPGADFAALAREHSQDPGSAKRGGDLGLFSRGRMSKEFEAAAFALKEPGDLSGVVRTEFGLHIIRLEERRPAGRQPFDKVRDAIIQELTAAELRSRRTAVTDEINRSIQFDNAAVEAYARQPR